MSRFVQTKPPAKPGPAPQRTVYASFRGVQLTDPYLCDRAHSPEAVNLISNNEGLPEIRPGYRVLQQLQGKVFALAAGVVDGKELRLIHAGTCLYRWQEQAAGGSGGEGAAQLPAPEKLYEGLAEAPTCIFFFRHKGEGSKAWILGGGHYLVYDGKTVQPVLEIATVPRVLIGKKPSGGGTPLQAVNLLTPRRCECFAGDGTSASYVLATKDFDADSVKVTGTSITFTVNAAAGTVNFATAPPKPSVAGEDNIVISYEKKDEKAAAKITACTIVSDYGESGAGRIFVAGNPAEGHVDRWSDLHDPSYFPDLNYAQVGSANSAILGYCRLGRYQAVVKEDNEQDTSIFLRAPLTGAEGESSFRLEPGVSGIGALARGSFVSLIDEPLFLSRTGVYALTSNAITAERSLQNRSYFVDERLCAEPALQNALAVAWQGYYLLFCNGRVYAFNARAKEQLSDRFVYNCFLWEGLSATALLVRGEALYFGDEKGRLCRLNNDLMGTEQYHDNGAPIAVSWSTCLDHDGAPERRKSLLSQGSGITTKPFVRSTYEVILRDEEGGGGKCLPPFHRDMLDLNSLDFGRFTLESSPFARFTPFRVRRRRYGALQIIVRGQALREGFGIYNLVKCYTGGGLVKG